MSLAGRVVSNRSAGAKPPFSVCWNRRLESLFYCHLSIAHLSACVKWHGRVCMTSGGEGVDSTWGRADGCFKAVVLDKTEQMFYTEFVIGCGS